MTCYRVLPICALLLLAQLGFTAVVISNQYILVDGERFFVRGADYSIVATGYTPDNAPDSAANTTYGRGIWLRDIANMKAMGGNTFRVYSMLSSDHTAFYDTLLANGMRLIVSMWVDGGQNFSNPTVKSTLLSNWKTFVLKEKHPAILMWCFGNELNVGGGNDGPLFSLMNDVRTVVQQNDLPNPRPVTTTFADRDIVATVNAFFSQSTLDVWSLQIYRGASFYNLFTAFNATVKLQKPMIVTEFGCDAFDNTASKEDQVKHASFNMGLWNEIYTNAGICSGGLSFNYADEWWRCDKSQPSVQLNCGNPSNAAFDNYWNQEWSGLYSIAVNPKGGSDVLSPRLIVSNLTKLWATNPLPAAGPTSTPSTSASPTTSTTQSPLSTIPGNSTTPAPSSAASVTLSALLIIFSVIVAYSSL
jgi:hypothetical protein